MIVYNLRNSHRMFVVSRHDCMKSIDLTKAFMCENRADFGRDLEGISSTSMNLKNRRAWIANNETETFYSLARVTVTCLKQLSYAGRI